MLEKEFKTYDELIEILKSRGMNLSTPALQSKAKKALQHAGYYNLINGYKMLFLQRDPNGNFLIPDTYREGSTVDEIQQLYYFDGKLRSIMLESILHIETNIKNLISHTFSSVHGHKNYLVYENFDTLQRDAVTRITTLISEIQRQLSSRVSDPSILHYLTKHGYVPFWVLNNILSLGAISKFYSLMKQPERQEIAKIFKLQDHELSSLLLHLSSVRNVCAHSNRLYCFRTKRPIVDLPVHAKLGIPRSDSGEFIYGKRDLFATLLIFSVMLPKSQFRSAVNQIDSRISGLNEKLSVLSKDEILTCMGFPIEWKSQLLSLC